MVPGDLLLSLFVAVLCGFLAWQVTHCQGRMPRPEERVNRRLEKRMERLLPDYLDSVAAGLTAGHSLMQSLQNSLESPHSPLESHLRQVLNQVKAGLTLDGALELAASRLTRREIPLALLTMAAAYRTGSSLAEALSLLSRVSRERDRLRRKISSLTVQARMQGYVLCLVPFLFLGGISLVSSGIFELVTGHPAGRKIIFWAAALQLAGALVIIRMINREVF